MNDELKAAQINMDLLRKKCIDICNNANMNGISFYFIIRKLKNGKKVFDRCKMIEKYEFFLYRVRIENTVSAFLHDCISQSINNTLGQKNIEIREYEVISDDAGDVLYTYSLNNFSVFNSIIDMLGDTGRIRDLTDLRDIKNDIFAYCISMRYDHSLFYSFRRIYPNKIKIVSAQNSNFMQAINAYFGPEDKILRVQNGDYIQLDNKIDCLFINDKFFVIQKKNFESLLDLESEFQEEARKVINNLISSEIISLDRDDLIESAINMQSIFKTLASVKKKGNDIWLDQSKIKNLADLHKKMTGRKLELKDGKICIRTPSDIKNIANLLNDYYKLGLTTKKLYSSNAGKVFNPKGENL